MLDESDAMNASTHISREKLAELHGAQWESLARTATWLVGSRQVGEELAQDAFVRLIEHWPTIADKNAAPAWLYRTVVNLSRSTNRRFAIGREKRELARADTALVDHSAEELGGTLVDSALGTAIADLPRRQRECLVLRYVQDMTVEQIATALEIGAGSVKTHLHRATTKLQTIEGLQPHDQ